MWAFHLSGPVLSWPWHHTLNRQSLALSLQRPGLSPGQSVWHLWFQRLAMGQVLV